jgi:8-oxo-dGTP pyrophosphatase MutT (NUDIX family)
MDLLTFVTTFKAILKTHPLPGHAAQLIMASDFYRDKRIDITQITGYKKSAVCLLFHEKNGQVQFLLIKRPDTHTHHAGQIALPGGSCDANETYEQTALRELYEETGISLDPAAILGRLSPFYIPVSNFYIQPIVAYSDRELSFSPSAEVESIIEFSLTELLDDSIISETEVTTAGNIKLKTPYFKVQGFVLWGATAMILSELKELLKEQRATFSFLFR